MTNASARSLRRSMTPQEAKLWLRLRAMRNRGYHFRRQAPIDVFIVDFACLKHHLIVELDGSGHAFHKRAVRDVERDRRLTVLGFRVLRFWNGEVDRNLPGVLDAILETLNPQRTPPTALRAVPPPRAGEG
jgi:very-short-patch-repair endonuclease